MRILHILSTVWAAMHSGIQAHIYYVLEAIMTLCLKEKQKMQASDEMIMGLYKHQRKGNDPGPH